MSKTSEITVRVTLDENNVPDKMEWCADDKPGEWNENQALIFSVWDSKAQNAMRIDLWTKDMKIDDMNFFIFQTIMTLSDTYESATENHELAGKMKGFGEFFAEQAKIFEKPDQKGHIHES